MSSGTALKRSPEERVWKALADPTRRRLLDLLRKEPRTTGRLAAEFETSRFAVMKHLRVLEEAELVLSKKVGRTRHLFFNHVPIQMIHDRWTTQYSQFWSEQLVDIKTRIENRNANEESKSA